MNESYERIPLALKKVWQDLDAELAKGILQYKAHMRSTNSHELCRLIEPFVDTLYRMPGAKDELRRRATLIQTSCGPGSPYDLARATALSGYRGYPQRRSSSKLAIARLRKSTGTPLFLTEVVSERREIEIVLNEGVLNLRPESRSAYESWRSSCREVERQAHPLQVDGAWYVHHIHDAGEDNPSDYAAVAKAITQTTIGGANLKMIRALVDSMMDFVSRTLPNDINGLKAPSSHLATPCQQFGAFGHVAYGSCGREPTRAAADDDPYPKAAINDHQTAENRDEGALTEGDEERESQTQTAPRPYVMGWREVLEALGLKNNDETKRQVRKLNDDHNGPIIIEGQGHRPRADKRKLIEWWNQLEIRWQERMARNRDERETVEGSGSQYKCGNDSIIVPEISGHIKKRRKIEPDQG